MATPNYRAEQWRAIEGFPNYEVSDFGRVRNIAPRCGEAPKMLALCSGRRGYKHVQLFDQGQGKTVKTHRLVCRAFHGPPPSDRHVVAHRDGSVDNNRAKNLRWATTRENTEDKRIHGTLALGERHGKSKLSADMVREIRTGKDTLEVLAARMGVGKTTISAVRRRLTWAHMP